MTEPLDATGSLPPGDEGEYGYDAFEEMVRDALDDLPEQFASRLRNVAVRVVDWPDAADRAHQRRPGILLGLFEGVPRTAEYADLAPASRISIFRGSLMQLFRRPEALRAAVREVVFHEIGHYFGIDDDRLDQLEREKWAAIYALERGV